MTIDGLLFSVFLALNLLIGLWYGRKVKTLKEYAIGHKQFATGTITASIVATMFGGGFMFYTLENIYTKGLLYSIPNVLGSLFGFLFTARVLIVRMGEFMHNLSVAEVMGDLYGKNIRFITAISSMLTLCGSIAIQFKVIPKILSLVFGLEGSWVIFITAGVIITYSAFGGIRSVTLTDIFQFIAICIFIPILILVIYNSLKEPSKITTVLTTNPFFSFKQFKTLAGWNPQFMTFLSLLFLFLFPNKCIYPESFQRIAMANSIYQARRAFNYTVLFVFLLKISVLILVVFLLAHSANLPSKELLNYIVTTYAYPGLKGIVAIGVIALAMSTADSCLNAAAVICVNDLIKPLKNSLKNELTIAKICSSGIGILAIILAYHSDNLLQLFILASTFISVTYIPPLLLAILGFRSTPQSALIGIIAGCTTVVLWRNFLAHTGMDSIHPGTLANALGLMLSHYLLPKPKDKKLGWVGIKDKGPLIATRQARARFWKELLNKVRTFRLYPYLKKTLPQQEVTYSFFAFYVLIAIYIPLFALGDTFENKHYNLYQTIFHTVLVPTAAFMTYPAWPPTFKWKPFMVFFWPLGIGYILFVIGTVLTLISDLQQLQVMVLMLNLVLAVLFLPWPLVLTLASIGMLLAVGIVQWFTPKTEFMQIALTSFNFEVIHGLLLFISLLIVLYKHQQTKRQLVHAKDYFQALQKAREQDHLHTLQHQAYLKKAINRTKDPLARSKKALTALAKTTEEKQTAQEAIEQIDAFVAHYKNSFYHTMDHLRLQVSRIEYSELLNKLHSALKSAGLHEPIHCEVVTQHNSLSCDVAKIIQLLTTSIHTLKQQAGPGANLTLQLQDTELGYKLRAVPDQNYLRKLPAIGFILTHDHKPFILQSCYEGNTGLVELSVPRRIVDLSQRSNEQIIDAHYGYSETVFTSTGMRILHVLPIELREIRPKVVDEAPLAAQDLPLENAASLAAEKALLAQLTAQTTIDSHVVQEIITYSKQVHQGQKRKSGDLFYTHPMTVASLLLTMTQDPAAIIAALLHDTVEDTPLRLDQVKYQYGQEVAFIVSKVTHLDRTLKKSKLTEIENQLQLAAHQDIRVVMVKLADRLHNLRTIQFHPSAKQADIAKETLAFYVPLGRMVGLPAVDKVVDELQASCQAILAQG